MSVNDDIILANYIIRRDDKEPVLFHDKSSIYKSTNENMNNPVYKELIYNKGNVLSVIGSGDQILNSVLYDSYNIDAYDISRFPKYFLELKIGAIKKLSFEEYVSLFYDKKAFNKKLFKKALEGVNDTARTFWEGITFSGGFFGKDNYSPREVYFSKLFEQGNNSSEAAIMNNPYLRKYFYNILRVKLDNLNIRYITGNIMDFGKNLKKGYDLINLSNICMYQSQAFKGVSTDCDAKFKEFITNLKLNDNGMVINYLMGYRLNSLSYRYIENNYLNDPRFSIYKIPNGNSLDDALLVYKKTK